MARKEKKLDTLEEEMVSALNYYMVFDVVHDNMDVVHDNMDVEHDLIS